MSNIVQGYWDCPYCSSKEISGAIRTCPGCGRARGNVKFYMKGHTEGMRMTAAQRAQVEHVDEEKAKYISKNPDWYCSFCETLNSDNAKFCSSCGASRESSESNYFEMHRKAEEAQRVRAMDDQPQTAQPQKRSKSFLLILIAVVVALGGLMFYLNGNTTQGGYVVSDLSWDRTIEVEQYRMFSESDWYLPEGAELTSQREELHHYDSVFDHYEDVEVQRSREVFDHTETTYTHEDMGNGYFQEVAHEEPVYRTEYYTETVQEPVYVDVPRYQTKYYYNIWRWVPGRYAEASEHSTSPYWPDPELKEDEREGQRAEVYRFTVELKQKNGEVQRQTYRIAFSDWQNLHLGDSLYITAKRTGADACISDEKGNPLMDIYPE